MHSSTSFHAFERDTLTGMGYGNAILESCVRFFWDAVGHEFILMVDSVRRDTGHRRSSGKEPIRRVN